MIVTETSHPALYDVCAETAVVALSGYDRAAFAVGTAEEQAAIAARNAALEEAFPEPRFGKRARRPAGARGATRSEARRGTSPT